MTKINWVRDCICHGLRFSTSCLSLARTGALIVCSTSAIWSVLMRRRHSNTDSSSLSYVSPRERRAWVALRKIYPHAFQTNLGYKSAGLAACPPPGTLFQDCCQARSFSALPIVSRSTDTKAISVLTSRYTSNTITPEPWCFFASWWDMIHKDNAQVSFAPFESWALSSCAPWPLPVFRSIFSRLRCWTKLSESSLLVEFWRLCEALFRLHSSMLDWHRVSLYGVTNVQTFIFYSRNHTETRFMKSVVGAAALSHISSLAL